MVSVVLLAVWASIVIYKCYQYMFHKPPNFPPGEIFFYQLRARVHKGLPNASVAANLYKYTFSGPPRIPVLGAYLVLLALNYKHFHKAIDRLCKYYKSNVLGFYYGPVPLIVVNDIVGVKEALTNADLAGRPNLLLAQLRDPNFNLRGVLAVDGDLWQEQRRFILRNLRDFGFGRRFQELELQINDEIMDLVNMIKTGPKHSHETVSY